MRFFILRRFLLCLFCLSLLSACCTSQQPSLDFMPEDVTPTGAKINAELKSITVNVAQDSKSPDQLQLAYRGKYYEQFFRLAVKDALERAAEKSAVFNDFSGNKLALVATILKYETANSGTTDLIMHYQLFNRATHELMFAKAIESMGAVAGNDSAFKSAARFSEARNMAVQANIQQFIASLKEFKGFTAPPQKHHTHKHNKATQAKQKAATTIDK